MSKSNRFGNLDEFENKEFNFLIDSIEHECVVSYDISTTGEYPSWDYPGDSESDVVNLNVKSVTIWDEEGEDWTDVSVTKEIEEIVKEEIVKYHKL